MTTREALSGIARTVEITNIGCAFYNRCPLAIEGLCNTELPPLREPKSGHQILCHRDVETSWARTSSSTKRLNGIAEPIGLSAEIRARASLVRSKSCLSDDVCAVSIGPVFARRSQAAARRYSWYRTFLLNHLARLGGSIRPCPPHYWFLSPAPSPASRCRNQSTMRLIPTVSEATEAAGRRAAAEPNSKPCRFSLDHHPPVGRGRLHSETEETEGADEQDGISEADTKTRPPAARVCWAESLGT